ncbi:hypothetical protein [Mesobacillus stamsii]|uniref:Uncharacterized protein n=1 Tax=Mesobacillus stamsii TaxID=225347 RepID=A0ABU0FSZ5_9BACI|nr:hypothetical protein [Mesobacillus stamsii]MDQ0412721.1 hypothetical protein [Mesobacillus stamsii]
MDIKAIMSKAIPAVEMMYDKRATIKRHQEVVKPNGADGMDWVTIYTDVPCRLSTMGQSTLDNSNQQAAHVIDYDEKMFLSAAYEIRAGDIITINGEEYETARKPFKYVSHQEVRLKFKGYA